MYSPVERVRKVKGWAFMNLSEAQVKAVKEFLRTGLQSDFDKINWKDAKKGCSDVRLRGRGSGLRS